MAKKVALKFGKHSRIDWKRNLNKMREAIKTDDQFQLQIYATIFTKLPKVVKNIIGERAQHLLSGMLML